MNRIDKLKEMWTADPADSFLQHALGLEYCKLGEDDMAQEFFENLLTMNPGYVGSYYHLAKLLERKGEDAAAILIYEKGMEQARLQGDQHAWGELHSAWEELTL